jgi:hypothetical protein
MDYEVGTCENCGGRLFYIYCLDEVKCEEYCMEDCEEEYGRIKNDETHRGYVN